MLEVEKHINILSQNKIPKNFKGDEFSVLEYVLDGKELMNKFFEAMIDNNSFKGELIIHSSHDLFDDSMGFKIGVILEKDNLSSLIVLNKDSPFSDRVSSYIGDVIFKCKHLKKLEVYMNIGPLSYNHIFNFLISEDSQLEVLKYLKISEDFIVCVNDLSKHFQHFSRIQSIWFYYEPFTELNLMYRSGDAKGIITQEAYEEFSDVIQDLPKLTSVKVIPWYSLENRKKIVFEEPHSDETGTKEKAKDSKDSKGLNDNNPNNKVLASSESPRNNDLSIPKFVDKDLNYEDFESFNVELREDIEKINTTFDFACGLNSDKKKHSTKIEKMFNEESMKMCKIIENLNLPEFNKDKNSIVSIRSYLNRTIGELLNKALYELDIQRERHPEDIELRTAKGSIKFIAKYLIEEYGSHLQEQENQNKR
mmetsp:Transcript_34397/g.35700  ORF Transcript_34397/g.35700 Transcript_34397/m.35700 type:complete len:422 (+) Transcript_34397:3-1268(+)